MHQAYDVAIVGYGPVGATLANLLGQSGLSVCVIERDNAVFPLPRAGHFDDEVMRVWQAAGLADEIAATVRVNPGMRFVNADGQLLVDWPRPSVLGNQAWHASYRFHQPHIEQILRQGVQRFSTVKTRLGTEVISARREEARVCLGLRASTGDHETLSASYIVGCDGGRSAIRRFMDVGSTDHGSHEKWLVVDLLLSADRDDLGDFTVQYCDPERPTTYIRMVGNRRRWELMLMPGDDPDQIVKSDRVWQLLQPWIGPSEAQIERAVAYTFHALTANHWHQGRFLLAGDAAHQTPPFLGQGMCAGIRDASNLAWKLAAVVKGEASESLLDSYQQERAPHVKYYIDLAIRLGGVLQATDVSKVQERDRLLGTAPEQLVSEKPRLGLSGVNTNQSLAGLLSDQVYLDDGTRIDDRVGYDFAVLGSPDFMRNLPQSVRDILAGYTLIEDEAGQDYLQRVGAEAIVLRPDRYILGAAASVAEFESLLSLIPRRLRAGEPA